MTILISKTSGKIYSGKFPMSAVSNALNAGEKPENLKTPFQTQLCANIRAYIAQAKRDGTVAMGVENLRQCVKPPGDLPGAPKGTNAQYVYAEIFREICRNERDIYAFTMKGANYVV